MDYHRGTLYASLVDRYIINELALEGRSQKFTKDYLDRLKYTEAMDPSGTKKDIRRSGYEVLRRKYDVTPWITNMLLTLKDVVDAQFGGDPDAGELGQLDFQSIMTGFEHLKINYVTSADEWGDQPPLVDLEYRDLADEYFGGLIRYLDYVYREADFTILSHDIFVRAYDKSLRNIHQKFEITPASQRYRFLGPLMASLEDVQVHNNLFMWMVIQLVVRPFDPEDFLEDYQDVFLDYHNEWVEREFAKLGIYDECDLIDFLSDMERSYSCGVYRLRPICQLSPALATPPLAHVIDYFGKVADEADFDDGDDSYAHAKEAAGYHYNFGVSSPILF